jgi:hypothetical protein
VAIFIISVRGIRLGRKLFKFKASQNDELNRKSAIDPVNKLGWRIVRNTQYFLMAVTNSTLFGWQTIIVIYASEMILIYCDNRTGPILKAPILRRTHKKWIIKFYVVFCEELNLKKRNLLDENLPGFISSDELDLQNREKEI